MYNQLSAAIVYRYFRGPNFAILFKIRNMKCLRMKFRFDLYRMNARLMNNDCSKQKPELHKMVKKNLKIYFLFCFYEYIVDFFRVIKLLFTTSIRQ